MAQDDDDNTGGRPSKMTPDRVKQICDYVKIGNALSTSFVASGISESAGFKWLKKGREAEKACAPKDDPFLQFLQSIKKAESEAEAIKVAHIAKAGQEGNWTASAWWLQRRRPERWNLDHIAKQGEKNKGPVRLKMELPKPTLDDEDEDDDDPPTQTPLAGDA